MATSSAPTTIGAGVPPAALPVPLLITQLAVSAPQAQRTISIHTVDLPVAGHY